MMDHVPPSEVAKELAYKPAVDRWRKMAYLQRCFFETRQKNDEVVLSLLEENPQAEFLDCGCGDGLFTLRGARKIGTSKISGIEIVTAQVAQSEQRGVKVVRADLNEALPYEDERFDVIVANQVIEHLHNTDVFIREIRRILKGQGYAVIATNNLASWHNVLSLLLGKQPMPAHISNEVILGNPFNPSHGLRHTSQADAHHRVFAWDALRELFRYHGFICEKVRGAGYYPFPARLSSFFTFFDPRHAAYIILKARKP